MKIQKTISIIFLHLLFAVSCLHALENTSRNCLILLDRDDLENIGRSDGWYLMTRLQSAIAEQKTPVLLNASLWTSFIERRKYFERKLRDEYSPHREAYNLYSMINHRMEYWSNYYNSMSEDVFQNKQLVVQKINNEFYNGKYYVRDEESQLLQDYYTAFDPQDWDIYKNGTGYYLFIPKKNREFNPLTGFRTDSLEPVDFPDDPALTYFDSLVQGSFAEALHDFFLTSDDFDCGEMPYKWNIVLAGHGGSKYKEFKDNQTISWNGYPVISDLDPDEFKAVLDYFHLKTRTNLFHYSCCYAGGNHIPLILDNEQKRTYDFAITCDTLTDCTSYCRWTNVLPSRMTKFLTVDDLVYDPEKNCWGLPLLPAYCWENFFDGLGAVDFSLGSIERLLNLMKGITYPAIANIPLLCLPGTNEFFPLQSTDVIKIDDRLVAVAEEDEEPIRIRGRRVVLVESSAIGPEIELEHAGPLRIISIQPGNAVHVIKKLQSKDYLDLPSVFWQAQYQHFDKTFLIEECEFPYSEDMNIFIEPMDGRKTVVLKNVVITQQRSQSIRIFFTLDDTAMMVVAHKPGQAEHLDTAFVQEVVTLTEEAKEKYVKRYFSD